MILHVIVEVNLEEVSDPANVITRISGGISNGLRSVEGVVSHQVTQVMPEDVEPPVEADVPPEPEIPDEEETTENV